MIAKRRNLALALILAALAWSPQVAPAAAANLSSNVHLFSYPWYGTPAGSGEWRHWQQGGHTPPEDVGADLHPALGAYDSGDPAIGGSPTWVSVTSFNEWHEGSVIESADRTPPPGHGYQTFQGAYGKQGRAAETAYLGRTRYWVEKFESVR
ncbi:hypothetical protein [Nonomuraea sp. NPDC003709]|uniref:hypothetical protein n=1 Tax=Nonomuraea sp. NPDC003709 TaxID=3154450 RepID=UPI0033B50491